jgi:hypothetical protein
MTKTRNNYHHIISYTRDHCTQFTTDSTLTTTVSRPIADHQIRDQKLYRPAVIIVLIRRNLKFQVSSDVDVVSDLQFEPL